MSKVLLLISSLLLVFGLNFLISSLHAGAASLAGSPLYFESNLGQDESGAQFVARNRQGIFRLSPAELRITLRNSDVPLKSDAPARKNLEASSVRFTFPGANPQSGMKGVRQLDAEINYLIGNEPSNWRKGVPAFNSIEVDEPYPGIRLVYYGNDRQLEYDFVVQPGADPNEITIQVHGADALHVDGKGELVMQVGGHELRQKRPSIYQLSSGTRKEIKGGYRLKSRDVVTFEIGEYDQSLPLIIDPVLAYSAFIGGLGTEAARAIALDNSGNVYVAGDTLSTQLGGTNSFQSGFTGGYPGAGGDAFVAKYDPTGTNLIFLTYIGGSGDDSASSLALDPDGNAYITGVTDSTNFPIPGITVSNQISGKGELYFGLHLFDAFVAKLSADGSHLIYATYLGGNGQDEGLGIAVDSNSCAYVTGFTGSTNFPVTAGAFQTTLQGSNDVFVTKIASNGLSFTYSTFLGGTNSDQGQSIAIDAAGRAFITGSTSSSNNFPVSINAFQTNGPTNLVTSLAFVSILSADGSALEQSTLLGGSGNSVGFHIVLDSAGDAYVTGSETGAGFPITAGNINSGGIFKSTDAAADWTPSSTGLLHNQIAAIVIDPTNTANIYAATGRGIALSTNAGASWQTSLNSFDQIVTLAIDPAQPSTIYAGSTGILKSTNSGASWFPVNLGLPKAVTEPTNTLFTISKLLVDAASPATVYAGTTGNGVFKTTTGGAKWNSANNGLGRSLTINDLAVDPANHANVYAATATGVFRSTNGVGTWKPFNEGLTNLAANAIAVDSANPSTVYLGMADGTIFKRTQANTNWVLLNGGLISTNIFFTNTIPFQSITLLAIDPQTPSTLYAGTRGGLFKSLDAGTNWMVVTNGLPGLPIAALVIDPVSSSTLYVGTFNNFAGTDAFLTKFNPNLSSVAYSVTFGGSGADQGLGLAVDNAGNAYIAGSTTSQDFPIRDPIGYPYGFNSGFSDGFVTAINSNGSDYIYSTYIGGSGNDFAYGIALDGSANAWVVGQTFSPDFPITDPGKPIHGPSDGFLAKIGPPTAFVDVTLETIPPGIPLFVDGTTNATPVTYHWPVNSFHGIAGVPIVTETNVQYAWLSWSDGADLFQILRATMDTNFTATFGLQYFLTMASTNISVADTNLSVNATNTGALSPISGWYDAGTNLTISVIPPAQDTFEGWVGTGEGSFTGPDLTTNITLNGPITETAIFSGPITNQIKVVVVGNGTVSPNLNNHRLRVGQLYTMTAVPKKGSAFSAWTGTGFRSEFPKLTFVMTNGLVLQAEFVPTPFVPAAATYVGLFFNTNAVDFQSSGFFSGTITTQGMLSAKLQMSGKTLPFTGQFNTEGLLLASVTRPGFSALSVTLQIDSLTNTSSAITGLVSIASSSAQLVANRMVFSKTNPPPQAGTKYTLIFPGPPDSLTEPAGDGYGTVAVDSAGNISFSGKLADGTPVSQKTFISQGGQWPFYISLYSGQGLIMGWLSFTNLPETDVEGTVAWLKLARPFTSLYPSGFTIESDAVGSLYSFTNGAPVLPLNQGKGEAILESGGLAENVTNSFALDTANKVTSPDKLSLSFTTSSGVFRGSMIDPATGKPISFSGAVLQKQNRGAGFFIPSREAGRVIIEPQF